MIHEFSVSNYGSIRETAVLDLRIARTAPDLTCFRRSATKPGVRLPVVAVLMGPNASGKSTLLRALVDLLRIVSRLDDSVMLVPFLSEKTQREDTRFLLEGEWNVGPDGSPGLFRYELTLGRRDDAGEVTDLFVRHEVLFQFPKGRRRRLFERWGNGTPIYVSPEFEIKPRDDRLKAVRPGASVIATLAWLNVPLAVQIADRMRSWLSATNVSGPDTLEARTSTVIDWLEKHPESRRWVGARIRSSDLGIADLELFDPGLAGLGKYVRFAHDGLTDPVLLDYESAGTRRLFHLLPSIKLALDRTGLAILDEIDGDLHVDIVAEILRLFRSRESNALDAQLLVSSHHVGLLDDLEKEEVFIVEKDDRGATGVYGLQDVRGLRRDVRLYPKYRVGVLGGLPRPG